MMKTSTVQELENKRDKLKSEANHFQQKADDLYAEARGVQEAIDIVERIEQRNPKNP